MPQAGWYPAALEIDYPERELDRLTTFFRPIVFIPIGILLVLLSGPTRMGGPPQHADGSDPVVILTLGAGGILTLPTALILLFLLLLAAVAATLPTRHRPPPARTSWSSSATTWAGATPGPTATPRCARRTSSGWPGPGFSSATPSAPRPSAAPRASASSPGRYPHATRTEDLHTPLPPGERLLPSYLQAEGYFTGHMAKTHYGPLAEKQFQWYAATTADSLPNFLDAAGDRPFFLWVGFHEPHRPYDSVPPPGGHSPSRVTLTPYLADTPETRTDIARYYDAIARMDSAIGAMVGELERRGLRDSTLLVFLSDNGAPFPREKGTLVRLGDPDAADLLLAAGDPGRHDLRPGASEHRGPDADAAGAGGGTGAGVGAGEELPRAAHRSRSRTSDGSTSSASATGTTATSTSGRCAPPATS